MIRLSRHARDAIAKRSLPAEWVERTITYSDRTEPDPSSAGVMRSFKAILEADNRVLRVVHKMDQGDILVITAFFDRGARP